MAAGVGIAPTLPVLQAGVETDYTIQRAKRCAAAWVSYLEGLSKKLEPYGLQLAF